MTLSYTAADLLWPSPWTGRFGYQVGGGRKAGAPADRTCRFNAAHPPRRRRAPAAHLPPRRRMAAAVLARSWRFPVRLWRCPVRSRRFHGASAEIWLKSLHFLHLALARRAERAAGAFYVSFHCH